MAKKRVKKTEEKAEPKKRPLGLVSVTFWCDEKEEEITYTPETYDWSADSQECELCGSHGKIKVSVRCSCKKKYHEIELYSW